MPAYAFEWRRETQGRERTTNYANRQYNNDKTACRAAMTMFRHRTKDPNDELYIYEGFVNGWGSIEGRLVGKIAYNPLGTAYHLIKQSHQTDQLP